MYSELSSASSRLYFDKQNAVWTVFDLDYFKRLIHNDRIESRQLIVTIYFLKRFAPIVGKLSNSWDFLDKEMS